jgi:hypothetical protein
MCTEASIRDLSARRWKQALVRKHYHFFPVECAASRSVRDVVSEHLASLTSLEQTSVSELRSSVEDGSWPEPALFTSRVDGLGRIHAVLQPLPFRPSVGTESFSHSRVPWVPGAGPSFHDIYCIPSQPEGSHGCWTAWTVAIATRNPARASGE